MDEIDAAKIYRALGDPNRLQIVQMLSGGEMCACRLLEHFQITQPTLSHHMKILCECGLVDTRREGKWSHYSLNCGTLADFRVCIEQVSCCKNEKEGCC